MIDRVVLAESKRVVNIIDLAADNARLRAENERLRAALQYIADHPVSDEVADYARRKLDESKS